MAKGSSSNNYEEARKLRLEENKKRFQDLGISTIAKKLTEVSSPPNKSANRLYRPKSKALVVAEPRRSSRARNPVPSYREEFGTDLPNLRKRSRSIPSSWESYIARPLDEIKVATSQERNHALEGAEALQINLNSSKPSFIKSMVRSHVYSCFWLGLPSRFCEEHLPRSVYNMVLEDEEGSEYEAVYIGSRSGLSGGWRAFALEHKLDDGDALVFELVEPARFKIYIVRAFPDAYEEEEEEEEENNTLVEEENMNTSKATKESKAANNRESEPKTKKSKSSVESLSESSIAKDVKPQRANPSRKTGSSQKKMPKKSELPTTPDTEAKIETPKPKATIRNTRSSQKTMQKISEVSTTLELKEEAHVETTKKELVQEDEIKVKKVKSVGRPRKNPVSK